MLILETGHELINTYVPVKLICNGEYFCLTQITRSKKVCTKIGIYSTILQNINCWEKRTIKRTRLILIRICKTEHIIHCSLSHTRVPFTCNRSKITHLIIVGIRKAKRIFRSTSLSRSNGTNRFTIYNFSGCSSRIKS